MQEYSKEVIKEMVDNMMSFYKKDVEKNGLPQANQTLDQYLADLSKDMPSEAVESFTRAAMGPLNTFLQGQIDASEKATEELTEGMTEEA